MSEPFHPAPHSQSHSTPQPSEWRTLTILLSADIFGDLVGDLLARDLGDRFEFRLLKFGSEAELWRMGFVEKPDLVFLYIGNIKWHPLPRVKSGVFEAGEGAYAQWVKILGFFSARFEVPVIAVQGMNLRAEARRAGIVFLQAPFKSAEFMDAVRTALGIAPGDTRTTPRAAN